MQATQCKANRLELPSPTAVPHTAPACGWWLKLPPRMEAKQCFTAAHPIAPSCVCP